MMVERALRATFLFLLGTGLGAPAVGQEPVSWGETPAFHTFSIAAVDPATGESGVAVTTRVACVGNGVPWVRAGVGAVATQAYTRTAYGVELLDAIEEGSTPAEGLARGLAADEAASRRQVGVIGVDGAGAQHTGDETLPWAGHRSGPNYVTQGNLLEGDFVLEAVAASFEKTAGQGRHLGDRLIAALQAGQEAGGDARKGRRQSAAVVVADPRPGRSRRPDGITVDINVCEHQTPVAELRRIYDTISGTLGFRTLQQYSGLDVWQLKLLLHALGYFRPDVETLERGEEEALIYTPEAVAAVDAFRSAEGLATSSVGSPAGWVDAETVRLLWQRLEETGRAAEMRHRLKELVAVRR